MFQGVKSAPGFVWAPAAVTRGNLRADECKTELYLWPGRICPSASRRPLRPRFFMRTALVFLVLLLSACAEGTYHSPIDGRLMTKIDRSFAARDACLARNASADDISNSDPATLARAVALGLHSRNREAGRGVQSRRRSKGRQRHPQGLRIPRHGLRAAGPRSGHQLAAPSRVDLAQRRKRKRRETEIPRRRDRLRMLQGGGAVEPGLEVPRVPADCGLRALRRPYQQRQSSPQDRANTESRRVLGIG